MKPNPPVRSRSTQSRLGIGLCSLALAVSLHSQTPAPFEASVHGGGEIYAFAVQPDGRIVVGGQIYQVAGEPRVSIARLKSDGSPDPDFQGVASGQGLSNPFIDSVMVQADGKILVHGVFFNLSGQARTNLGRLNADGTLDSSFNPGAGREGLGFGPLLGIQPDGRILAHATLTDSSGHKSNFLARLNRDGSLDPSFRHPALGPVEYGQVSSVVFQEDGKTLVGGQFFALGGWAAANLARLDGNGSPDAAFASPTFDPSAPWLSTKVEILAVQPDGRILVGGRFSKVNGAARTNLARLHPDGSLDATFAPQLGAGIGVSAVTTMVLQTDGKIWLGGYFGGLTAGAWFGLGRLHPDGTPDSSFEAAISGEWIHALAVQTDGPVLVGGDIYWSGARAQTDVARLSATDPATQALALEGTTITWLRGGASPEVWGTSFESSSNGLDWVSLGAGRRIAGGWECGPVTYPPQTAIRARGFIQCGAYNRSAWFAETIIGRPGLTTQPVSRTNHAGTTAEFAVVAGGTAPVRYQWLKDGVPLVEAGSLSGTDTPVLTLRNVIARDAGDYSVLVSNPDGSVTSALAKLTVLDPAINVQPVSQLAQGGLPATLSVTAGGTPPLAYQWRKDGILLPGATGSTLAFAEVRWGDRGRYEAVISNSFGCLTSAVAVLTINLAPPDSFHPTNMLGAVTTLAVQPDGKILVACEASEVSEPSRYYFTRVKADGTPDDTFRASLDPNQGAVLCVAVQPAGQLLVGGWFRSLGGAACSNLARLHPDGTLDTTFQPDADNTVASLIALPDGKTMVGGSFTRLGGLPCTNLGRLNPDGTLDPSFTPQADGLVTSLLGVQTDGKILVGAQLFEPSGWSFSRLERLQPDGALDPSFANPEARQSDSYTDALKLAVQADGKLLVSGPFESLAGVPCTNFGRLNADGTFDLTFLNPHPAWTTGEPGGIDAVAFQADGRVLVSGYFLSLAGQPRGFLARLEGDGSLDETFNPAPSAPAASIALQPDGKILLGGSFWTLGGIERWALARLNNTGPALESLSCDGSTVTWLRGGASPEIWSATFEFSNDGTHWVSLGTGTRLPGGWQRTGVSLSAGTVLRARGLVAAARSSWFIETSAQVGPRPRPGILCDSATCLVNSHQFRFAVSGRLGQTAIVESSLNLGDWTALTTNVLGPEPLPFTAPQTAPQQFYRARLWP